jgi:hypothetical protein
MTYQSEKEQLDLIDVFRPVDGALNKIAHLGLEDDAKNVLLRRLTSGLFNKDYDSLKEVQDPLQAKSERLLSNFLKEYISDEEFKQLKDKESILSQKTTWQLNYNEKIKIAGRYLEEEWKKENFLTKFLKDYINDEEFKQLKIKADIPDQRTRGQLNHDEKVKVAERYMADVGFLSAVKELILTNKVRNAFAHGDAEQRITLEEFTAAIVNYCNFIHSWKKYQE